MLSSLNVRYLLIAGAILAGGGGTWAVGSYIGSKNNKTPAVPTAPDTTLKNSKNDAATTPSGGTPATTPPADSSPKNPPQSQPAPAKVAVTITNASQQSTYVAVRALVDGTTSGTCTLELSKSGQSTISRQAPLVVQANYVTCQGFNVALSDFPVSGQWTALIKIESAAGAAQSQPVTINVQK